MMERRVIRRGDIYYADLNPVIGSEQGGMRPVLVISNNTGNYFGPTVIVAPITSKKRNRKYPTHMKINSVAGLQQGSTVLFEQLRVIDKTRLREYIGTLDRRYFLQADRPLHISIGLH